MKASTRVSIHNFTSRDTRHTSEKNVGPLLLSFAILFASSLAEKIPHATKSDVGLAPHFPHGCGAFTVNIHL